MDGNKGRGTRGMQWGLAGGGCYSNPTNYGYGPGGGRTIRKS